MDPESIYSREQRVHDSNMEKPTLGNQRSCQSYVSKDKAAIGYRTQVCEKAVGMRWRGVFKGGICLALFSPTPLPLPSSVH